MKPRSALRTFWAAFPITFSAQEVTDKIGDGRGKDCRARHLLGRIKTSSKIVCARVKRLYNRSQKPGLRDAALLPADDAS